MPRTGSGSVPRRSAPTSGDIPAWGAVAKNPVKTDTSGLKPRNWPEPSRGKGPVAGPRARMVWFHFRLADVVTHCNAVATGATPMRMADLTEPVCLNDRMASRGALSAGRSSRANTGLKWRAAVN